MCTWQHILGDQRSSWLEGHLAVEPLQGLKLFRFWPVGEKLRHGGREVLLRLWKSELLVLEAPLHSGMDQHLEKKKVTKVTKDQGPRSPRIL